MPGQDNARIRIWDPFVRLSHWTIVAAFFIAYFSGDELLNLHAWAGYVLGMIVLLRIVWGMVGSTHARFSDFLYRPTEVAAYLRELLSFRGKRYVGHSPAGGVMVVMLLAGLLATVGSGMVLYAIEENAGPLAGWITSQSESGSESVQERLDHNDNDDADEIEDHDEGGEMEGGGELWEEAHDVLANLMLFLVILHVAGVLLASYVHRENLAKAMITGLKRAPPA